MVALVLLAVNFGHLQVSFDPKDPPSARYDYATKKLLDFARSATKRGPFNNKWLAMVPNSKMTLNPDGRAWTFTIFMHDGTTATAQFDVQTGALSSFSTTWPPPEPIPSAQLAPIVSIAKTMLRSDGVMAALRLKSVINVKARSQYRYTNEFLDAESKRRVSRDNLAEVQFLDEDANTYLVNIDPNDRRRLLTQEQALGVKARQILKELGISSTIQPQRFWIPQREAGPPIRSTGFWIVSERDARFRLIFGYPKQEVISIQEESRAETPIHGKYAATRADVRYAVRAAKLLGLGHCKLTPFDFPIQGAIRFTCLTPASDKPWTFHATASLSLDLVDHHLVSFDAQREGDIEYANIVPPIDLQAIARLDKQK